MSEPSPVIFQRRLMELFAANADPIRAVAMAVYMKNHFPFLGLSAPVQRQLVSAARAGLPEYDEWQLAALCRDLYGHDEREFQYVACDEIRRAQKRLTPSFLPVVEELITTKPWWDTVDVLCRHGAGEIVRRHPSLRSEMDRWLASDNLWLIRSAILHQERWGALTDVDWLFAACLRHSAHRDFFVRKAIGWALRTYAHTDARTVAAFVDGDGRVLSGLSRREALKRVSLNP